MERPAAHPAAPHPPGEQRGSASTLLPAGICDRLAAALFTVLAILVVCTFRDYGISTDEYVQQTYGEKLWALYLSGFADRSVFAYENLYLYGGLFDMLAVALQAVLPLDAYEVRHLLCGFVGILGVVGTWRLARSLAGPQVALIAAALLALTASWYGAAFNNTKDIPFATGMVWLTGICCTVVAQLPRPRASRVVLLGIVAGLTLGIRVGAAFGFIYLAIGVAAVLLRTLRVSGGRQAARDALASLRTLLPALPLALAVMVVFWPWSALSPLNVLNALPALTGFVIPTQLDGQAYATEDLPALYLPVYLLIKLPELALLGLLAALAMPLLHPRGARPGPRARANAEARAGTGAGETGAGETGAGETGAWHDPPRLVLLAAIVVPLLYWLVAEPRLYNGIRHFFFVVPPLCVAAAIGLHRLHAAAAARRRWIGHAVAALLLLAAAREVATMVALHPHQYIYYNALVGGPGGAYRRYELDYWSNFAPEAIRSLAAYLRSENHGRPPRHPYTVSICTSKEVLRRYAPDFLRPAAVWEQADFFISTTNTDCDRALSGRIVVEVSRDGAVLGVVKDRRPGTTAQSRHLTQPVR